MGWSEAGKRQLDPLQCCFDCGAFEVPFDVSAMGFGLQGTAGAPAPPSTARWTTPAPRTAAGGAGGGAAGGGGGAAPGRGAGGPPPRCS